MVEILTKRLSLVATLFFLPGIFILSWWAWQGFETPDETAKRATERQGAKDEEEGGSTILTTTGGVKQKVST